MGGNRNLLWIIPLAVVAAAPLWWSPAADFLRPRGDFTSSSGMRAKKRPRTFVMEGMSLSQMERGEKSLEIEAQSVRTIGETSRLMLKKVSALLFDSQGNASRITGNKAIYNTKKQVIDVAGKVTVASHSGYEIQSESMRYLAAAKRVETEAAVLITGPAAEVQGHGLRYDVESGDFRVGGRVLVTLE